MAVLTFTDACTGCGACLLTCPTHAIRPVRASGGAALTVLADRCTACGECVEVCPADAVRLDPADGPPGQERGR